MVVSKGPTVASAISTSTGRGAKAQASSAASVMATTPPMNTVLRFMVHSLVFSAATMSSLSMRLRTTSALAAPAATMQIAAQA